MKVCFVMNFCSRDSALAPKSAAALKSLYPTATVLTIEDNPPLKTPDKAGQWTERWMQAAMGDDPDIIIKLDPDTRALKAVQSFPTAEVFGQVAAPDTYFKGSNAIISGGCIGFQAEAVKKILDSGFLRDEKYTKAPYAVEERRYGKPRPMIALNDPIVDDIAQRLKLTKGAWIGIDIHYSWEPARPFRKDATFVHPVRS
jgi:hypothetical protein